MKEIILQELGFSAAEAKVYLTLLRTGPVKVGKIIEQSGLQSSTIHNTLHSLIKKGFVNYVLYGKIKRYQAVAPKILLQTFKEKEKQFEEIIPELEQWYSFTKEKPFARIYEGTKGIMTMLYELIEDAKPKDHYSFFAVDVPGLNKDIQKFFERYDKKREEKKLLVRGIARKALRPLFIKRKFLKMKYVDFPIPSNISICNNKMALIMWEEKPHGILIKSSQLAQSQIHFFNELWQKTTPKENEYEGKS